MGRVKLLIKINLQIISLSTHLLKEIITMLSCSFFCLKLLADCRNHFGHSAQGKHIKINSLSRNAVPLFPQQMDAGVKTLLIHWHVFPQHVGEETVRSKS